MTTEFELGGRKFKIGRMNTFKQFHVVRRLAPLLGELLPALTEIQKKQGKLQKSDIENLEDTAKILQPILAGFSKLSDGDSEFVLYGLLSCVEVQLGNSWAKVATENMLMVQDLELPALLQIAGRAFMANLSSFFALLPTAAPQVR